MEHTPLFPSSSDEDESGFAITAGRSRSNSEGEPTYSAVPGPQLSVSVDTTRLSITSKSSSGDKRVSIASLRRPKIVPESKETACIAVEGKRSPVTINPRRKRSNSEGEPTYSAVPGPQLSLCVSPVDISRLSITSKSSSGDERVSTSLRRPSSSGDERVSNSLRRPEGSPKASDLTVEEPSSASSGTLKVQSEAKKVSWSPGPDEIQDYDPCESASLLARSRIPSPSAADETRSVLTVKTHNVRHLSIIGQYIKKLAQESQRESRSNSEGEPTYSAVPGPQLSLSVSPVDTSQLSITSKSSSGDERVSMASLRRPEGSPKTSDLTVEEPSSASKAKKVSWSPEPDAIQDYDPCESASLVARSRIPSPSAADEARSVLTVKTHNVRHLSIIGQYIKKLAQESQRESHLMAQAGKKRSASSTFEKVTSEDSARDLKDEVLVPKDEVIVTKEDLLLPVDHSMVSKELAIQDPFIHKIVPERKETACIAVEEKRRPVTTARKIKRSPPVSKYRITDESHYRKRSASSTFEKVTVTTARSIQRTPPVSKYRIADEPLYRKRSASSTFEKVTGEDSARDLPPVASTRVESPLELEQYSDLGGTSAAGQISPVGSPRASKQSLIASKLSPKSSSASPTSEACGTSPRAQKPRPKVVIATMAKVKDDD